MKTLRCFLIVALAVAAAGPLNAQIVKKAQAGFRFLENPVSAEVVGRGSVGVTTTLNANGLFWNPALIGWVKSSVDLSLNHTRGIADINYSGIAAAARLGEFGVLGASLLSMDYGTFYGTRVSNNALGYEETGEFSPKAYAIGLAFAQQVSDRFSYGIQVKYVSQNLGSAWVGPVGGSISDPALAITQRRYKQSDFALDVGAYYDFMYNGIRFGATLQNISREVKFETEAVPMPFAVCFGLTVEPLQFFLDGDESKALLLAFETRHPRDYQEKVKFGAEYTFMDVLVLRTGYMKNFDERGLTAGIGVRQEVGGIPLRADYAYQAFGVFGAVHHLSLAFSY